MPNSPPDDKDVPSPQVDSATASSSLSRQYSRRDLGAILQRASELQAKADEQADGGFSMTDIRQIASEVGIEPRHVESAARALNTGGAKGHSGLGAPWRFRFEETVESEISDDLVSQVVDLARRETSMQGKVSQALDSIEWSARDSLGATIVQITRRGGRTTLSVLSARTDAAVSVGMGGAMLGIAGSVGMAVALAMSAGLVVPVAIAGGLVAGGGGSWLLTRAGWRRLATGYSERAEHLAQTLIAFIKQETTAP